ncbi:MAG: phospholipase D-like domain-containing protein [Bacteroidia bacterium]
MLVKQKNIKKYFPAESVELINSGDNYFDTLEELIGSAKEEIHLQTYIFDEDKTGTVIANALMRAADRGVQIFILVDAYGSKSLSYEFIERMQKHEINFRFFSPLFSKESIYLGRRLHHKIVVADRKTALVGGINIADKYHGTDVGPAWLDYAVLIRGDVCTKLSGLCEAFFQKRTFKRNFEFENVKSEFKGQTLIRFSRNDWVIGKNEIYTSYHTSLKNAERSAIFIASYFLPGYKFRKLLKQATKRGVAVKIILAGKSDLPFFWYAEKYLYNFYLKNGIEIIEWGNSVMHGKALIIDGEWTTIGSYNHNYLSHYRSIELNVEINDKNFSGQFTQQIDEVVSTSCEKMSIDKNLHSANFLLRTRNYISYIIYRVVMKIFVPGKIK